MHTGTVTVHQDVLQPRCSVASLHAPVIISWFHNLMCCFSSCTD